MPPAVIDIRKAEDTRDVVHRAVEALARGNLVAFPTETVYGLAACARHPEAVDKLIEAKGRAAQHPMALAVKSASDALDYVPNMSPLARRLSRRCWPGPVTLVLENHHPDSLLARLPQPTQSAIMPQTTIGLRVPAHPLILDVLRMHVGPLVLTSANKSGESEALDGSQVVEALGDRVALVLDDGQVRFGQPSTVVKVGSDSFDVLRAGVVSEATLKRLSSLMILFVCTGNTCRSPMAEALCRKFMAERLDCSVDELEDRGVLVMSAGIAAMLGSRASSAAVEAMQDHGLDIREHESQPLTNQLIQYADIILTMTSAHRAALLSNWPDAAERTMALCHDGSDVADPIGGSLELYKECAEQIKSAIEARSDVLGI
ncbi:MAG: threonylcarbamoyl-AMP synthase [Pirellulales bacterium]|nr:threonylcarbamoyl-AMP synthase [Pirellulales bacterium]